MAVLRTQSIHCDALHFPHLKGVFKQMPKPETGNAISTAFLHNIHTMPASYLEPLTMLRLHDAPLGSIIKTFRCCCEKDCFLILSEKWHNSISPLSIRPEHGKRMCSSLHFMEERR